MDLETRLDADLIRYWGYSSFRPGQQLIARSIAEGRDVCVIMPTGGGKSLCYQLPAALAQNSTAIVVSPLIALMQDQVTQLEEMGIPAAVLNSSLSPNQRQQVRARAIQGAYRLLYLSPETIALPDTPRWLAQVNLSFFVIDEAHCISEWGHDFRPEYRQLSSLRRHFPDLPIAAFTASATQRVRRDIVQQLKLHDPHKHIASFRRPNLNYHVRECNQAEQEDVLLDSLRNLQDGSAIVYAPTIKRVDEILELLRLNSIDAVGYHGKMESSEKQRNQKQWTNDEVRVLVGTVAFGLGINKAAVRKVIHLALPKSIEQYYQEAGRAGRDGLPSECILLWQKRDAGIHSFFIGQISDKEEKERAWQRYHEIKDFVLSGECRQAQICRHFGEEPKDLLCGNCDRCLRVPVPVVKKSAALPVRSAQIPASPRLEPAIAALRDDIKAWRRTTSLEKDVPAFVIMHDSTLDDLCAKLPSTLSELRQVKGFGEKKTEQYGQEVVDLIRAARLRPYRKKTA